MIVKLAVSGNDLIDQPYDGVDRYVIDGELRENPSGALDSNTGDIMPVRNRFHSRATTATGGELRNWLRTFSLPRGEVLTGDAGLRLALDPERTFGVDVMVVSAEVLAAQTGESTIIEGVPTLCVEILSPSEVMERIDEKTDAYLAAGVPLVWLLDLHDKSVTVYSPGAEPILFNRLMEISGEPHLPGFRVPVANLFE
jgi:Uma2 family endonuclease